jgi:16S rRNA (guanine527-N7)-methyltransferase
MYVSRETLTDGMLVSPEQQLATFAAAIRESPHNLVSRSAQNELETRHIPESVAFATWLPADTKTVLDIGSGGGFPGIVIAIMRPEITVHLAESVGKKAAFLSEVVERLELSSVVHPGRIESLARSKQRPQVDAVTARAVAPLRELAAMAAPFLRPGGYLYAIKGARWREELDAAQETLRRVKLTVHALPDDGADPALGTLPRIVTLQKN